MAGGFDGNGNFFFTYSWANDAANGVPITASRMDGQFNDAVSGFDLCITRDGQGSASADIPWNSHKITGLGVATNLGDALSYGQAATVTTLSASNAGNVVTAFNTGASGEAVLCHISNVNARFQSYVYGGGSTDLGSLTTDGTNLFLSANLGSLVLNSPTGTNVSLAINGSTLIDVGTGSMFPAVDNTMALGGPSNRYSTVYAATGTINTSGADTKSGVRALSDAEIACSKQLCSNVRVYQFVNSISEKGYAARLHVGMIHEDVVAAFQANGLDPYKYGIVCRDPDPSVDGSWIVGLRYDELAQFLMAGMNARLMALEAK